MPAATHGATRRHRTTPEYNAWTNMRRRCEDTTNKQFADYGGRGITVCDRWRADFAAFLASVGPRPSARHSLDRIDNNRGYEPGNVRWATKTEQSRNRRSNRLLTCCGETLPLCVWAERLGVRREAIRGRIARGWSEEAALSVSFRANAVGANNSRSKLDDDKVRAIRELAAQGVIHREIGMRFGVGQTVVSAIVRGDRWKHVA